MAGKWVFCSAFIGREQSAGQGVIVGGGGRGRFRRREKFPVAILGFALSLRAPMQQSIHGHKVMERIAAAGRKLSRSQIIADAEAAFGADARFHTCAAENLTVAELLDFLEGREKLVGGDDAMELAAGSACDH
jgi:probable metal-binding protein